MTIVENKPWDNPVPKGIEVDGSRYSSRDFMEKEWEFLWPKVWLLLGREDELPNPGDYQMEEFGRESFLMVRQKDGSVKSFYNVCSHRGARLINNPWGKTDAFKCPYHGWVWGLEGELIEAQDAEDFPEGNPCGKLKLKEVKCDTFAGFVWINMDKNASSLKEWLGPVWEDWQAYEIDKWKPYLMQTVNLPCNWKIILDNFNESYHLNTVHAPEKSVTNKRIASGMDTSYRTSQFDLSEQGHNRMIMKGGYAFSTINDDGEILDPLYSVMKDWGINPDDYKGKPERTREALQKAKRTVGPDRGYTHYKNLRDDQFTDAQHYTLFPNFAVSVWTDGFHFLRARPHPTDPEQSLFDHFWYASHPDNETAPVRTTKGIVERNKFAEREFFNYGEETMGQTIDQDTTIFVLQQKGLRSRGFERAYYANQESRVHRFHELIEDYFNGVRP